MTEKKLKPAAKKATSSRAGAGKSKSKAARAAVAPPEKKPAAKPDTARTPAVKNAAASVTAKNTPVKKSAATRVVAPKAGQVQAHKPVMPTPDERYRMVETAAYFIAERHGFQGRSEEHWAAAEREIAARLGL